MYKQNTHRICVSTSHGSGDSTAECSGITTGVRLSGIHVKSSLHWTNRDRCFNIYFACVLGMRLCAVEMKRRPTNNLNKIKSTTARTKVKSGFVMPTLCGSRSIVKIHDATSTTDMPAGTIGGCCEFVACGAGGVFELSTVITRLISVENQYDGSPRCSAPLNGIYNLTIIGCSNNSMMSLLGPESICDA